MSFLETVFRKFLRRQRPKPAEAASPKQNIPESIRAEVADVVSRFEQQFGIHFKDAGLITTALKHRSFLNMTDEMRVQSNERLEFLGDAVLDLVVTHFLYEKFPKKTEGHLSKVKSILVSKPVIADVAKQMNLGELVLMNRGEEKTGGRMRKSILADAFEAIIGAIYLDSGLEPARRFILQYLLVEYRSIIREGLYRNYKSLLLEYAQSNGRDLPDYRIKEERGPDHAKEFVIEVWIAREKLGTGKGKSKKIAEQEAAKKAVRKLDIEEVV